MLFSTLKVSGFAIKNAWILIAVLVCATHPAYADVSAATENIPVAEKVEQSATDSSVVPEPQAITEPVIPFYEKPNPASAASKHTPTVGSGSHLLNVTLGLMAIIGLIFALSLFVKRFGSGAFSANTHLKIISSMPLGTRERIVLIDAGGQQLLLGITPTNINTLHVFADPIVVDNKPTNPSEFSQKLMAILQQKPASSSANNKNNSAPQE
jgi:flagellar protein FliO/FliZ